VLNACKDCRVKPRGVLWCRVVQGGAWGGDSSGSVSIYIYKYAGGVAIVVVPHDGCLVLKNRNQKLRNNLHVYLIAPAHRAPK